MTKTVVNDQDALTKALDLCENPLQRKMLLEGLMSVEADGSSLRRLLDRCKEACVYLKVGITPHLDMWLVVGEPKSEECQGES